MQSALIATDVHAADEASVRAGVPVDRLMERAGSAVAMSARHLLDGAYGRRVTVLAGPGNNGGDGFVAGRQLRAAGALVTIACPFGMPSGDAAAAAVSSWHEGVVLDAADIAASIERADLIVDALFGVSLSRPLDALGVALVERIASARDRGALVLAVDLPSGVDATTGQVCGAAVAADVTVTFVGPKVGLLFEPARTLAGHVVVVDIGAAAHTSTARCVEAVDFRTAWPWRDPGDHKRLAGRLLVVAGSRSMPGAAILTARASVRAGAGMTTVLAPSMIAKSIAMAVPEATTIPALATPAGVLGSASLDALHNLDDYRALAIGPGLSRDPETAAVVCDLLSRFRGPAIVDADALHALRDASRPTGSVTVVTPHAGEWRAMVGTEGDPDEDRLAAARLLYARLAEHLGDTRVVVVVLKGPGTVVVGPSEVFIDDIGTRVLAQGGSGDALTGVLGAAFAQTARRDVATDATTLTALGVWLHASAGARLGAEQPTGASRLIEMIPEVLKEVQA